eukprot:CAMPEP_0177226082 /NCGR_PEP_ID=MMETSP0367-20130122/39889_1 /TAXON_ID=447022 ORGANISM="Scrippsiella hangoei-like, Strain SHHI-4" /NCGR_SAMPLE_ID=MMETSP0367 /ASSEMBLY_ACC=CAM_ASM_000362 /LENGTH=49 /DNA_ID= /DNA_START= /DNA_END= /DNA_ORIENTATION=
MDIAEPRAAAKGEPAHFPMVKEKEATAKGESFAKNYPKESFYVEEDQEF